MNTIAKLLSGLWQALGSALQQILSALANLQQFIGWSLMMLGSLLVFTFAYIIDAVGLILPLINQATNGGAAAQIEANPALGALSQGFSLANAVLPLTEAFGLASALMVIWILCVSIRVIKAWLPTMN